MNIDLDTDKWEPSPELRAEVDRKWASAVTSACRIFGVAREQDVPSHLRAEFDDRVSAIFDSNQELGYAAYSEGLDRIHADVDRDLRHQEVIASLDRIEHQVARGNVVADTVDFAKRHPFLAGFFGMGLFNKIRDR